MLPGFQALDAVGPIEVFTGAGALAASRGEAQPYRVELWAERAGRVSAWNGLEIVAQRSYLSARVAVDTLLVAGVPAVREPEEAALVTWLTTRADSGSRFLSVCEGARLAAAAGLLEGRRATTHFFALDGLAEQHPGTEFRAGHRYVEDGPLISTAGVSAASDGALFALSRISGDSVARDTAARLGIAWHEESDPRGVEERPPFSFASSEIVRLVYNTLFRHRADRMAVLITPGVSEIALAAAFDTFPRSLRVWQTSFSPEAGPVRSRSGLGLIAEQPLPGSEERDHGLWILPSGSSEDAENRARGVASPDTTLVSFCSEAPGHAFTSQLDLLAERQGEGSARAVARMLELPWEPAAH